MRVRVPKGMVFNDIAELQYWYAHYKKQESKRKSPEDLQRAQVVREILAITRRNPLTCDMTIGDILSELTHSGTRPRSQRQKVAIAYSVRGKCRR